MATVGTSSLCELYQKEHWDISSEYALPTQGDVHACNVISSCALTAIYQSAADRASAHALTAMHISASHIASAYALTAMYTTSHVISSCARVAMGMTLKSMADRMQVETPHADTDLSLPHEEEPFIDSSTGEVRITLVDQAIAASYKALEEELQKGDEADYDKLYSEVLRIVRLQMIRAGRYDHEYAERKAKELDEHVKNLQGTYNNKWSLTFTTLSAAISVFAGIGGFSTLGNNYLGQSFASFADLWSKNSQALGMGGQAIGSFSKTFDEKEQSARTKYQHEKDTGQSKHSTTKEDAQKKTQQAQDMQRQQHEWANQLHQLANELLRGG
jgi:hypothetical protein